MSEQQHKNSRSRPRPWSRSKRPRSTPSARKSSTTTSTDPRRHRRRARGERRGVRAQLRAEGRQRAARALRRGGSPSSPTSWLSRRPASREAPRLVALVTSLTSHRTAPRSSRPRSRAASLRPATAAPRWATSSPSATSRRSSRPMSTRASASPAAPGSRSRRGLFEVQLEHYEKLEGTVFCRRQGQPACRADPRQPRPGDARPRGRAAVRRLLRRHQIGRIFSYDVTGGRDEEHAFHAVGSGSGRPRGAQEAVPRGPRRDRGHHGDVAGALRRCRRRLCDRRP